MKNTKAVKEIFIDNVKIYTNHDKEISNMNGRIFRRYDLKGVIGLLYGRK